jgi:hypothetical protein
VDQVAESPSTRPDEYVATPSSGDWFVILSSEPRRAEAKDLTAAAGTDGEIHRELRMTLEVDGCSRGVAGMEAASP